MTQFMFKNKYSYEEREKESKKKIEEFPGHVPIILEKKTKRLKSDKKIFEKNKTNKFLVPRDIKYKDFIMNVNVRNKFITEKENVYIFFTNGKKLEKNETRIGEIYDQNKDDDGFLYIVYTKYESFG